ncbi:hypothetical protein IFM89_036060 [Coptis chinensis]|uniref:Uncharacterized protein n=1 Tax=Coptis chinensis TaxID=261450 RepID=A0A835LJR5_9MAGN|nr:hypothetical protein IFM89_036060 [Coptis chinensis]
MALIKPHRIPIRLLTSRFFTSSSSSSSSSLHSFQRSSFLLSRSSLFSTTTSRTKFQSRRLVSSGFLLRNAGSPRAFMSSSMAMEAFQEETSKAYGSEQIQQERSCHVPISTRAPGLTGFIGDYRVQLEISEAMDMRTRQGLLNALVGKAGKRMDTLLIPLELVCCISRTEFSDKKAYLRWQKRQLNMLEEGLINHPAVGFGESGRKASELRSLLMKIDESESLPSSSGELQRAECLRSLREIAIPLAERPVRGDLTGEVCHWADGYHLNEVEEILELIKSTWKVLGITETIHYTCYAWVLFHQYVITGERGILEHAIEQMRKIPLKEQRGQHERLHLKKLSSKVEGVEGFEDLTFLLSFLRPIQKWADKQLGDYHLHFAENAATMEEIVTVAMLAQRLLLEEPELYAISQLNKLEDNIREQWARKSLC